MVALHQTYQRQRKNAIILHTLECQVEAPFMTPSHASSTPASGSQRLGALRFGLERRSSELPQTEGQGIQSEEPRLGQARLLSRIRRNTQGFCRLFPESVGGKHC